MLEGTLLGAFQHTVDTKNRIFIPVKFREILGDSFIIFKSLRDKCIRIVSYAEWDRYTMPFRDGTVARSLAENIMQVLTDDSCTVTPDSQGRIIIPPALLNKVGITKNATIYGRGPHAEIWAEDVYNEKAAKRDLAAMLEDLDKYGY